MKNQRAVALEIFHEALDACSLHHAFASKFKVISPQVFWLDGRGDVDLTGVSRILIVAIGKGSAPMLNVLLAQSVVTQGREISGILVSPRCPESLQDGITYFAGGHPAPNSQSFEAARAILQMLDTAANSEASKETFCFFLVSGGASAMMELPLDPEITLDDTIKFHRALVHSGASIGEINCVRKHFSAVKGGRLAVAAGKMRSLTIAVSDVPAGQLDVLASGPTMPDTSTIADCKEVLAKYDLLPKFPQRVRQFFESQLVESPKPGDFEPDVYSLLSSDDLAQAARASAVRRGLNVVIDNSCDDWDYQAAADYLLEKLRGLREEYPVCLISAGEVTVRLSASAAETDRTRVGGRNLQFALYCALQLSESDKFTILSAGSDGIDGSSPAAGAVVDPGTIEQRDEARLALEEFDSFPYLDKLDSTIMTGPTGNNLRDLRLLICS